MNRRNVYAAGAVGVFLLALVGGCTVNNNAETTPPPAGLTPPAGCTTDSSVQCSQGDGWSCGAGDNPEAEASGLSCSSPTADGPNDDFCCFEWTAGTSSCTPDDMLTSVCTGNSYGYQCAAGDNPNTLDSSLNCSTPTPDGSSDDFCCN